jgi:hypothetical protein
MRKNLLLLFLAAGLFFQNRTQAAIGAVSTATGGTGRGAVEAVDGALLNPATIGDLTSKNFSVSYSPDEWGLSVVDNGRESYFPAALDFVRTSTPTLDTQQLGLSLASRRWHRLSFGATASMYEYTDYLTPVSQQKYRQGALDVAATVAVTSNFGFGVVAKKVASGQVPLAESRQVQKTTALGMSYTYQNFARFRFDVESAPNNKTDKLVYMMGLENYINDFIVFRLGYQDNQVLNKDYFSAGVGFSGPQFGLHYAYISNVSDKSEDQHLFDLNVPF